MSEDERNLERIIAELNAYEQQARILQRRIDLINASLQEIALTTESLDELKNVTEDNEVLMPLGSGVYVRAKIIDMKKVITTIGAEVAVDKDITGAQLSLDQRSMALQNALQATGQQLQEIANKINELNRKAQTLVAKIRG
ncbi:MAG: prefoldin subunit alpha [Candidatus Freyarchaeota archaeon]|nr:prefoldin subunit alpha [Candidatus Jordarchaeia archaeon]MBS7270109.1 prefoldin subunit alpha [Candidatus Jordarchaeia archaeon]MBS7280811.1 prefoldin subunit alpha [Candidatus Jordarchaeia archaeon]